MPKVCAERVRPDGARSRVAEVIVGDETGCIILTANNGDAIRGCTTVFVFLVHSL